MTPLIAHCLSYVLDFFPKFFDFSVIPASLLANDSGGAHLTYDPVHHTDGMLEEIISVPFVLTLWWTMLKRVLSARDILPGNFTVWRSH